MTKKPRKYIAYALLVGLPVLGILSYVARDMAVQGSASRVSHNTSTPDATFSPLTLVLELLAIIATSRAVGGLFRHIGQPRVVGEMLAGILLGPSVLGALAPSFSAMLFPAAGLSYLNAFSQIGLVLFMFLVGIQLDLHELREHGSAAVRVSHVSVAVPMFLGVALAAQMYERLAPPRVSFIGFALFMGVAMSITAFPVLARILADRDMLRSPVGALATACAAVDDVTGWSLLAVIVVIVRGPSSSHALWLTILGPVTFTIAMLVFVRPQLGRVFSPSRRPSDRLVAFAVLFALAAAAATEYLGTHLVFGAFLAGVIMPRRPDLLDYLIQRLETLTNTLLLPLFFAYAGLRTSIGLIHGVEMWGWAALIMLTAVAGKLGGSMIAARTNGTGWREALAVGTLMNTRGLMELVALNIGLDVGVITPSVYSMMVLMALFTTLMTGPLLSLIYPPRAVLAAASSAGHAKVLR